MVCKKLQEFDWDFFFFSKRAISEQAHLQAWHHSPPPSLCGFSTYFFTAFKQYFILWSPSVPCNRQNWDNNLTKYNAKFKEKPIPTSRGKTWSRGSAFSYWRFFFFFLNLYFKIAYGWRMVGRWPVDSFYQPRSQARYSDRPYGAPQGRIGENPGNEVVIWGIRWVIVDLIIDSLTDWLNDFNT